MSSLAGRKRAVHEVQKEERRQAILDTAWELFQTKGYETLTIAEVASSLGLAKGTMFRYFSTKEALFLALVEQQLTSWFAAINTTLTTQKDQLLPSSSIVQLFSQELTARPGLTRLLAILHTLLEQNIDFTTALHFKTLLSDLFQHTGPLLEHHLPFLQPGQGEHLLIQSHALVIGFWHLSDPAPVVQQVLAQPAYKKFVIDFTTEFTFALQTLLYGLEWRAHNPN